MWNFLIVVVAVGLYCWQSDFVKNVDPVSYKVNLPDKFDGPLTPNEKLDDTERLFQTSIYWPESFAVHSGNIYTGLGDGRIVRVTGEKMITICRTGKECAGQHEEHICGRPLGMEFNKNGVLYVVDAYLGLFSVDIKSGEKYNILPSTTVVDGHHLKFLNNLAIDEKEGAIYMTQSSTKWDIGNVLASIVEHESSGRLLKYDLKTKKVQVLLTDLCFPNGVTFSNDGSSLLIAEGNKNKIFRYTLRGPKAGAYSEFSVTLPGEPDNISNTKRGSYWVGLATGRSKEFPAPHDRLAEYPLARKALLLAQKIILAPITSIAKLIPHKTVNEFGFELSTFRIIADLPIHYGMIVEIDEKGNIIQSVQSPSGKVARISEVLEHSGYLYLGSWRNRYLGRLKLKQPATSKGF